MQRIDYKVYITLGLFTIKSYLPVGYCTTLPETPYPTHWPIWKLWCLTCENTGLSDCGGTDKSPRRQKPMVFNTLFLGKNKLKQRDYIRTKLRLENLIKIKSDSETLTSISRQPPGLELKNPNASEASYEPKQLSYIRTKQRLDKREYLIQKLIFFA